MKGESTRCVLRTNSPHAGSSPTPSPPRKNKQRKSKKESPKTIRWIGATVVEVGDKRRWFTRRAGHAPGKPFSWATHAMGRK